VHIDSITTLQRREIQAPLVALLIREMIAEIGYDSAIKIASAAIQKDAVQSGRSLAEAYGGESLPELLRAIQEVWASGGALELAVLEASAERLSFDVTRCRYAELYERLGVKDLGGCLSCGRDAALIQAFNPRMRLERTRTIMQGDPVCDFRITLA
jgi:predicted hydrocarbon binding protein